MIKEVSNNFTSYNNSSQLLIRASIVETEYLAKSWGRMAYSRPLAFLASSMPVSPLKMAPLYLLVKATIKGLGMGSRGEISPALPTPWAPRLAPSFTYSSFFLINTQHLSWAGLLGTLLLLDLAWFGVCSIARTVVMFHHISLDQKAQLTSYVFGHPFRQGARPHPLILVGALKFIFANDRARY